MGVVIFDNQSYALLKCSDEGTPYRVKEGESVPGHGCSVTKIFPGVVWLADAKGRAAALKDQRFAAGQTTGF